jgi:hypothetical protein
VRIKQVFDPGCSQHLGPAHQQRRDPAEQAVRANSAAHAAMFAAVPPEVVRAATVALRDVFAAIGSTRRPPPQAARGAALPSSARNDRRVW